MNLHRLAPRRAALLSAFLPLLAPLPGVLADNRPPELDLLFASRVMIAEDTGAGEAVAVVDVDGDGRRDVVAAGTGVGAFTVYRNATGAPGDLDPGSFAPGVGFGAPALYPRIAVGDVDGDGRPEVVVAGALNSYLQVFRNTGSAGAVAFDAPVTLVRAAGPGLPPIARADVALGDVDGDGRVDVLAADPGSAELALFRNTGSPGTLSFAARQGFACGPLPQWIEPGDLDGDGRLDVAVLAPGGGGAVLSILRNTSVPGTPAFAPRVFFTAPLPLTGLVVTDLDRDSKLDVAAAGTNTGELRVWRNTAVAGVLTASQPNPSLEGPVAFPAASRAFDLVAADVDLDGRPDLVIVDPVNDELTVLANDSAPETLAFESLGRVRTGDGALGAALGDLDGDGRLDLAVTDTAAGSVQVRRNTALVELPVNSATAYLGFNAADDDDPLYYLELETASGNPGIVPEDQLAVTLGEGEPLVLEITPAPDAAGTLRVTVTARDTAGATSSQKLTVLVGCVNNVNWPDACPLRLTGNADGNYVGTARQAITQVDQSRWFRFTVQPESQLFVTLTELAANYDLFVFKDILATYEELLNPVPEDLALLGAEFAPAAFSPAAFSPAAFSPAAFSPAAFSPAAFSPAAFSPAAFSPAAFSPAAFSPAAFSPAAFSPAAFSPAAFSPAAFSPAAFSPAAFSPAAFSAAQTRSLIAVSAFPGTAGEGIFLNTWGSTGDFYICVRGRNGVFVPEAPFRLEVLLVPGGCAGIATPPAGTLPGVAGPGAGFRTLVLADFGRMNPPPGDPGVAADLAALQASLAAFIGRDEVRGVVVDVSADAAVAFANAQADATPGCVLAKNLVARAIRDVVLRYRAVNPGLEYVMLLGHDDVLPYFRYPDTAGLASEQNFIVPVDDNSASQASLRLGYVLSQDAYGALCEVTDKLTTLPLADIPVARLVERPAEIKALVDLYLTTPAGLLPTPVSSLVTGYDFLVDAAEAIDAELRLGMGTDPGLIHDQLIAPRDVPPQADPATTLNWSADELAQILFARRHDIIFLAGHYNDGSALAADYTTELKAAAVAASAVDMVNSLVFGAGCHVGYNTVDPHAIADVTQFPDWAQAFARKGVTAFIGGTSYQYGDTELIEYHERLYLEFARQLRTGAGPVSIGHALLAAKREYLRGTPLLRGIHQKTFLVTTLFGFPMLRVDLPGARLPAAPTGSVIPATAGFATDPGDTLNLQYADITFPVPPLTPHTVTLQQYDDAGPAGTVTASYLSGPDGVVNNPAEPLLPLMVRDVTAPTAGEVLRGVGFRTATYADEDGVLPLTGMPATEIRGVGMAFQSDFFFPVQPWSVDYFDAACGDGRTRLNLLLAQHVSDPDDETSVTRRRFSSLGFRLYYSGDTATYTEPPDHPEPDTPSLADAPAISRVTDAVSGNQLTITAQVVANPASGIQEVWVTYTATRGPWFGQWESADLVQQPDTRFWEGVLTLPAGTDPADVRYLVQAVSGVGLVTLNANQGLYFTPGHSPPTPPALTATTLTFDNFPLERAYGETVVLSAVLGTPGGPVVNQRVSFGLGTQRLLARTDAAGRAEASLTIVSDPAPYALQASFAGDSTLRAAAATTGFQVVPQATSITLEDLTITRPNLNVRATLRDTDDHPLPEQSLFFVLTDALNTVLAARPVITDYAGRASLGLLPLGAGTYTLRVYFNGDIPLEGLVGAPTLATRLRDPRYLASEVQGIYVFALTAAPQTIYRAPGRTAKINVAQLLAASQGLAGATLSLVSVGDPQPSGASVGLDDDGAWIVYQPAPGPDAAGSFAYTIQDQDGAVATGLVTVALLGPDSGLTLNIVSIQPGANGAVIITFVGIPGLQYDIQATEVLGPGTVWTSLDQRLAGPNGEFVFTDPNASLFPQRYYRAVGP